MKQKARAKWRVQIVSAFHASRYELPHCLGEFSEWKAMLHATGKELGLQRTMELIPFADGFYVQPESGDRMAKIEVL
jgi:hypothetical protein